MLKIHIAKSQMETITNGIKKYLPIQLVDSIIKGEQTSTFKTERKKLTIFFSDIKGFTEITDNMEPEELSSMLNEYIKEMTYIAHKHGGTIDKFVGDAMMVFFGALKISRTFPPPTTNRIPPALLPDIDHPESLIGRIFPGLARWILRKYGHRTVTHSVFAVFILAVAMVLVMIISESFYIASIIAYSSHIFIDLFNYSGIKLFAPLSVKEYISFRTTSFRILVSSWKEYLLLFIIIILAVSLSGKTFSFTKAIRTVSKLFYRHYEGAMKDYQYNSKFQCIAKINYFDNIIREIVEIELPVLNIFPEKIFLLKNSKRIILKKSDINEIEIIRTEKATTVEKLSGSNLNELNNIPPGSYVSGRVTIYNYFPDIKSNDFIKLEKGIDTITLILTCVEPHELNQIMTLGEARLKKIEALKHKSYTYQLSQLKIEEADLKKKIHHLNAKGFYSHYSEIIHNNNELKKIESKIDTINLKIKTGGDDETLQKIEKLEKGYNVEFILWVYKVE